MADVRSKLGAPITSDFDSHTGTPIVCNQTTGGISVLKADNTIQEMALVGGSATQDFAARVFTAAGDIYTTAWTAYGATSTIVGFSAISEKNIFTKKIGKLCFVKFGIVGTSNATNFTFTLPFTSANDIVLYQASGYLVDNTIELTSPGLIQLPVSSNTVTLYKTMATGAWTASGGKYMYGEFFYETA